MLEGGQGKFKSTALKTLGEPWFSDQLDDVGSKDAAMQAHAASILELAELESIISRPEVGRVKAFMSRATDCFRPPYGRRVQEFNASACSPARVNDSEYLRDPTGGRRFWPVACTAIDIDALPATVIHSGQKRAQGSKLGIRGGWTPGVKQFAEQEQANRYEGGVWDDIILAWLARPGRDLRRATERWGRSLPP